MESEKEKELNDKIFWLEDRIEKLERTITEFDNKLFDLRNYVDNLSLSSFSKKE